MPLVASSCFLRDPFGAQQKNWELRPTPSSVPPQADDHAIDSMVRGPDLGQLRWEKWDLGNSI